MLAHGVCMHSMQPFYKRINQITNILEKVRSLSSLKCIEQPTKKHHFTKIWKNEIRIYFFVVIVMFVVFWFWFPLEIRSHLSLSNKALIIKIVSYHGNFMENKRNINV